MPTYGVTSAGFVRKPLSQILVDIKARLAAGFGSNCDFSADGPFGQMIADLAAPVDEAWQMGEDTYFSFDPDVADGKRLDAVCSITGTIRKTPTKSTVSGVAIGVAGSVVKKGALIQVQSNGPIFQTQAEVTIAALAAWVALTAYNVLGVNVTNGGNVYRVITTGVAAGAGGPAGVGTDIVDGTVHWRYLGPGTAAVEDPCESVDFGAFTAAAGTLNVIVTPVAGLDTFTNPNDSLLGQAVETSAQLRSRRFQELAAQGEGGVESLRADILKVSAVTDVRVFENITDVVDGDGLEPHSVECVVLGGSDADVAKVVFTKGAGIRTHGTTTVAVIDSQGFSHDVKFTRPVQKNIWIIVNVTKDPTSYAADGDAQIKQALVDFANGAAWVIVASLGSGYAVGDDVIQSKLYAPIEVRVSGIVDVTKIWIGLVNPPVGAANVAIGSRELAKFDTARITVVSI